MQRSYVQFSVLALCMGFAAGCTSSSKDCGRGQQKCGGACVYTLSDPANCGLCGKTCEGEQVCSTGTCQASCGNGLENCHRQCVDLNSHPAHCGACDHGCQGGAACVAGQCVAPDAGAHDAGIGSDGARDATLAAGDAGSDAKPVCAKRVPIVASGALDVPLPIVTISGAVKKNGGALGGASQLGYLVFREQNGGYREFQIKAGSNGLGSYTGEIFVGTYEVSYQQDYQCSPSSPLPCQATLIRKSLAVAASGTFDVDLKVVEVSGALTKNGQALPIAQGIGNLWFVADKSSVGTIDLSAGASGVAYKGRLFAGTYAVEYRQVSSCSLASSLPCQSTRIREGVAIQADGALDLNVKVVEVSGALTRNGKAVPSAVQIGDLYFTGKLSQVGFIDLVAGASGMAYKGRLFADTYAVEYRYPSSSCSSSSSLPCQSTRIREGVAIQANGALDLDVKVVEVSGALTKNGQPMPSAALLGDLSFTGKLSQIGWVDLLAGTSGVSYKGQLFADTYTVEYQNPSSCSTASSLPCQSTRIRQNVSIQADGALDLDVKVVEVSGALTKNGKPMPSAVQLGDLYFVGTNSGIGWIDLFAGTSGASYKGQLFADNYGVEYRQSSKGCTASSTLPCQATRIKDGVAILASGALDLDVQVVTISGSVTKNGQAISVGATLGAISFDGKRSSEHWLSISPSGGGGASYRGELFSDEYEVYYRRDPQCQEGNVIPCQSWLFKGCYVEGQ